MFTAEQLETTWKAMREFERSHFGLKFGEEFPEVAALLRASQNFMQNGAINLIICSFELSAIQREMKDSRDPQASAQALMERPNELHNSFAEIFYLGYLVGKKVNEVEQLEKVYGSDNSQG